MVVLIGKEVLVAWDCPPLLSMDTGRLPPPPHRLGKPITNRQAQSVRGANGGSEDTPEERV
uniref:Uncharacterized protein n=1 Tax=Oryza sativa subsp. japonica TaxID=39947 RepID=Q6ATE4_ORYSJ|nr:hypothetical protein [Oryza sativa Japonica Group]AAV32167.1 hypothetical protein [Oryza sativa Japonica Group]